METMNLSEAVKKRREEVVKAIREGKIFIYPTDTIYGIGCSAEKADAVEKIRKAKGRDHSKPMSVIAPSKEWIKENAKASKENMAFAESLLPGPYTVVMKANSSAPRAVVTNEKTIGIRIPLGEFTKLVEEAGVPFVTTSVNLSGGPPIKNIKEIPDEIRDIVDYIINAGEIDGHPSRVFDLTTKDVKILRY